MKIVIRNFNQDVDKPFITSSWINGAYYGAPKKHFNKSIFCRSLSNEISELMKGAVIRVACIDQDFDTLLGFCCVKNETLEWIYVKEPFRKQGIAKLLLSGQSIKDFDKRYITRLAATILKEKEDARTREETRQTEQGIQGDDRE